MKVMHKERLKMTAQPQTFYVPKGTKIRKFALQDNEPTIWIEKPTKQGIIDTISVQMFGTGHAEIPNDATYIDSVFMGAYVWHLYQVIL